ncbi:SseB family protein [Streptomyces xanthophaeus]|uniref:SseB family protein n=1 Tax=Streptomyces xanthophaeus TaxID=67385 RepID=UPI0026490359|nr:SseB family protein [Streptomyces xanthophaeus]WKD37109.1 SseB family protein [Streptomyces xanthophaeus]
MGLTEQIASYREGRGDPARLVGEFRRTALLVPLTTTDVDADAEPPFVAAGGLMSAVSGGIRWLYAFTDEEALARFARARGEDGRDRPYLAMLGARLLDAVVPMSDGPTGVAVDVADGDGSMLFPPVAGIVPDACAVDVDPGADGGRAAVA